LDEVDTIKARAAEIYTAYGLEIPTQRQVRCPLGTHPDHHPSFRVRADGVWFCTCGGGDVLTFLQVVEATDFRGAKAHALEVLGIRQERLTPEERTKREAVKAERAKEQERLDTIDAWHDAQCRAISERRWLNGPEPTSQRPDFATGAPGTAFWSAWAREEAAIKAREREVDRIHDERGGGYVAPRLRLPFLDKILARFEDADGNLDVALFRATLTLYQEDPP
jgi:hypothetical protein